MKNKQTKKLEGSPKENSAQGLIQILLGSAEK